MVIDGGMLSCNERGLGMGDPRTAEGKAAGRKAGAKAWGSWYKERPRYKKKRAESRGARLPLLLASLSVSFVLTIVNNLPAEASTAFSETFDGVTPPTLPSGWTTSASDPGATLWTTSSAAADTPPNAAFVPDASDVSDNLLISPSVSIVGSSPQLKFGHSFNFEQNAGTYFDGGVLEISIDGSVFVDILAAGGSFVFGGYNGTLAAGSNPLAGRQGWGGSSGGFITTTVDLPASAGAGHSIQLLWREGTDFSNVGSPTGWLVDTVTISKALPADGNLVIDANDDPALGDQADDGTADTFRLHRSGGNLQILINDPATPVFVVPMASLNSVTVNGSSDQDSFGIDEAPSGLPNLTGTPAASHTNAAFVASGRGPASVGLHLEGGGGTNNRLQMSFLTTQNVAYFSDTNQAKSGVVNVLGELTISFDGLSPMTLIGAGGTLTVDATSTPATANLRITNSTDTVSPGESLIDGDGGFEDTTFSGWDQVTVRGGDGPETLALESVDPGATPGGVALDSITLDGDNTTNTDTGSDVLVTTTLPATVDAILLGGDSGAVGDEFRLGRFPPPPSTVDGILGRVIVSPAADEAGDNDFLFVDDSGDATPDTVIVTSTTIEGITGYAGSPDLAYNGGDPIESIQLNTGTAGDGIDVQSMANAVTINTRGGNDTIDVMNVSATGPLVINGGPDSNTATIGNTELSGGSGDGLAASSFSSLTITTSAFINNAGNGLTLTDIMGGTVGGSAAGAGNTISGNGGAGIRFLSGAALSILGNSISLNGELGIDLGGDGVTPNDPGDGDSGPNDLQNFPVLTSATSAGGGTTVRGTLNSTAGTTLRLQLFSNTICDSSGRGEGERFLGSSLVTTDGGGNTMFTDFSPTDVPAGHFVTATATNPAGSTSEFSACRVVRRSSAPQRQSIPT